MQIDHIIKQRSQRSRLGSWDMVTLRTNALKYSLIALDQTLQSICSKFLTVPRLPNNIFIYVNLNFISPNCAPHTVGLSMQS